MERGLEEIVKKRREFLDFSLEYTSNIWRGRKAANQLPISFFGKNFLHIGHFVLSQLLDQHVLPCGIAFTLRLLYQAVKQMLGCQVLLQNDATEKRDDF